MLLIGEKSGVLETMNQFLEKSGKNTSLSKEGQVRSLYFYGMDCVPCESAASCAIQSASARTDCGIDLNFSGNIAKYGKAESGMEYIFVLNNGASEDETESIRSIPFERMYAGAAGEPDENLLITCTFPFELAATPTLAASETAGVNAGGAFAFSTNDPTVSIQIRQLAVAADGEEETAKSTIVAWQDLDSDLITLTKAPQFDQDTGKIEISCSIDTSRLAQDEP
jgi:hypothetical protein